jgi:hypothetical protein
VTAICTCDLAAPECSVPLCPLACTWVPCSLHAGPSLLNDEATGGRGRPGSARVAECSYIVWAGQRACNCGLDGSQDDTAVQGQFSPNPVQGQFNKALRHNQLGLDQANCGRESVVGAPWVVLACS